MGDLGYAHELGNYAEYSGGPSTAETHAYARTLLDAATASPGAGWPAARLTRIAQPTHGLVSGALQRRPAACLPWCGTPPCLAPPLPQLADGRGRSLIVGGGIANFTDVAATFKGIIQVGCWAGCGCWLAWVMSPQPGRGSALVGQASRQLISTCEPGAA